MIKDIYTKGFVKLSEPEALDMIRIDDFRLPNTEERLRDNTKNDVDPKLAERLDALGYYLKTKYIDPEWTDNTYNKFIAFEGVDSDNRGWHTDMFEDYDVFFLYYFDDTHEATGGAIHFKWRTDAGEETYSFQPKAGDLVLINNTKGFWHRADATSIKRRVVSFDFTIND
jgi:hypothetical protein